LFAALGRRIRAQPIGEGLRNNRAQVDHSGASDAFGPEKRIRRQCQSGPALSSSGGVALPGLHGYSLASVTVSIFITFARDRLYSVCKSMRLPLACLAAALAGSLAAQQTPPQTVKGLKVAPGLEVRLWASEPSFVNPTNIDIDSRGRIWVLEAVNYRRQLKGE